MIARWIGAAPRQRGNNEGCKLIHPIRGDTEDSGPAETGRKTGHNSDIRPRQTVKNFLSFNITPEEVGVKTENTRR